MPPALRLGALRATLDQLAERTWGVLELAYSLGRPYGETTLTDQCLLDIAVTHPALRLYSFNAREEGTSGADWAWWIGNDRTGWVGMRVQAKRWRLTRGRLEYGELGHTVGQASTPQIQLLLDFVAAENAAAFHVFYNGWSDALRGATAFQSPPTRERFGCAAISTGQLDQLRGQPQRGAKNAVATYAPHMRPWSDLFLPPSAPGIVVPSPAGGPPAPASPVPPGGTPSINPRGVNGVLNALTAAWSAGASHGNSVARRASLPDYVKLVASGQLPTAADIKPEYPRLVVVAELE